MYATKFYYVKWMFHNVSYEAVQLSHLDNKDALSIHLT